MSTRTTCKHCGNIVLRRGDGIWFSNPSISTDASNGYRCAVASDRRHAPASADDVTDPEVLRLRARVAELEAQVES